MEDNEQDNIDEMEEMEDSDEIKPGFLRIVAGICALLTKFFGIQILLAFVCAIICCHNNSLFIKLNIWLYVSGAFFVLFFSIVYLIFLYTKDS